MKISSITFRCGKWTLGTIWLKKDTPGPANYRFPKFTIYFHFSLSSTVLHHKLPIIHKHVTQTFLLPSCITPSNRSFHTFHFLQFIFSKWSPQFDFEFIAVLAASFRFVLTRMSSFLIRSLLVILSIYHSIFLWITCM